MMINRADSHRLHEIMQSLGVTRAVVDYKCSPVWTSGNTSLNNKPNLIFLGKFWPNFTDKVEVLSLQIKTY